MVTRAISGLVFITIVIGSLWGGFIPSLVLFSIIGFIGSFEFYTLSQKFAKPYTRVGALFTASIILIFGTLVYYPEFNFLLAVLVLYLVRFVIILLHSNSTSSIADISITIAGSVYLSVPFIALLYLGIIETSDPSNFNWKIPLSVFILTWTNDTGAYIVGKNLGKHKLFERVSPNKTWEGSFGGMVFTGIGAIILFQFWPSFNLMVWIGAAVLISIFANLGDLMESAFKRNANMKDSGKIMPGHGGVLDRFDAILLNAPIILAYLLTVIAFL